jgi:TolB protein
MTTALVWAWGPAGTRVAYASRRSGDGELFVFDPSDGTRRPLGRVDGRITALSWSPDGRRIAVAASGVLYLVDVASGEHAGIATYQGIAEDTWSAGWPAGIKWSPDGTRFALVTHTSGVWTWSVHILSTNGRQLADLRAPGGGSFLEDPEVAWSPDGTRIAYTVYYRQTPGPRRLGGQVWTAQSFGQVTQKVFDPGCCAAASLRPAWSPDGSQLGFTHWAVGGARQGLVVDIHVNGTGGEPHSIDERLIQSWRGGSFSSEGWGPGQLSGGST